MEFVRPQLAKIAKPKWLESMQPGEWVAEMKLDGHRRLLGRDVGWSRIGTEHAHPELQAAIPEGWLLDGEIVVDGATSSHEVNHLLAHDRSRLRFVVFDVLWARGENVMDRPWSDRRRLVESLWGYEDEVFGPRMSPSFVYHVGRPWTMEGLMAMAGDSGHEGVMLKKASAPYKANSRSAWMKHKFVETYDVVITDCESRPTEWRVRPGDTGKDGVHYPEGRHSDPWLAGNVGLSYGYWDATKGRAVKVGATGITGPLYEMRDHIGKVAEFKSYGPAYETGALRHPVFIQWRVDKNPWDCVQS